MLVTKWTKFKYSGFVKAFTGLLILAGGTVFIWCILWFMMYGDSTQSEVADSHEFSSQFLRRVHNVVELTTELKSIEYINELTTDEEERSQLYRRYNQISSNLTDVPNFIYIIRDVETQETIKTNTKLDTNKLLAFYNHVVFSKNKVILKYGSIDHTYEFSNYLGYINGYDSRYVGDDVLAYLSEENYEVYAAIKDDLIEGDIFYDLSVRNDGVSVLVSFWRGLLMVSSVVFSISLILMAFICGRKSTDERIRINGFDRIFTELQLFGFIAVITMTLVLLNSMVSNQELANNVSETSLQLGMIAFIMTMIGLVCYCSLIRQIKGRILLKTSILGYCIMGIKSLFWRLEGVKLLKPSWLLFLMIYGLGSLFSGLIIDSGGIILFILIQVVFLFIFLKQLTSLKKIMEATKRVSLGELDVIVDTDRFPKVMVDFYDNIYHVQTDMRKAVQKAIKGERMKAELITNVSHDLKTPLTSIISYIDLLSKEPLETEESKEYVEILVRKSDVLKRLIEDLIDASKVSTGNVQIECTRIGVNELVRQGMGEFEEKFSSKNLDIRVQEEDEELAVLADGKSMWRVIENIFDNVTKYALPNSRVYIELSKVEDKGMIVIKNISEVALEVNPDELLQRFVRGAESRTTEGSGLGLSIAEGLVKAQKGDFKIDIDGDLFKVTIEMPIIHEVSKKDENLD